MVSFASVTRTLGLLAAVCISTVEADAMKSEATFLACPTAPATPGDRRKVKTQLKFSTYNAEFLFLEGYGTLDCPGSGCKWKTASDAQQHIMQVAKVIKSLDSDIIQMNEVEDCAVLNAVIVQLELLGDATYKPYLVRGTDTATGQNSALLTRVDPSVDLKRSSEAASIPVSGSTCPKVSGASASKSVSKHFYTSFNVPGFSKPITLVGAHLLANPQDKVRCFEREAQASVLSKLANAAILNGHHAIISGDLNDFSATVPDKNSNKPISNVLGLLTGTSMTQVAANAPQETRFTQWWDKNNDCEFVNTEVSSLDHVLVSKSLASSVSNVSFGNTLYQASCGGFNSDHYPITITIDAV
ncbi:hypothetical protein FI667_g9174, partial [Globisporangium splendens]